MKTQFRKQNPFLLLATLLILGLALYGCGDKDNMNEPGNMNVRMTDSPADFEAMVMDVNQVEAYIEGEGWIMLNSGIGQVDILKLTNGEEVSLAQEIELEAGLCTMLRVSFGSENYLTIKAGGLTTQTSLTVQSNAIIEVNQEIKAGESASLLLDFHAAKSIAETAIGFVCDPVITYVEDESTGAQGRLEGSARAHIEFVGQNSQASFEAFTNAEGEFLLRGLEDGLYDCKISPQDSDTYPDEVLIEGVLVIEGEITQMGTLELK